MTLYSISESLPSPKPSAQNSTRVQEERTGAEKQTRILFGVFRNFNLGNRFRKSLKCALRDVKKDSFVLFFKVSLKYSLMKVSHE